MRLINPEEKIELKTGILLRRAEKKFFYLEENKPQIGEIVFALDTQEIGSLVDDEIVWSPIQGIVGSVAGKQGDVQLDKNDVGLENVDNTADLDKPISNLAKEEFRKHYNAENPHNITKKTIGLENVDNTADLDKPISNLTEIALSGKISWDDAREQAKGEPKFTDTTYEIKDGELSEFNFNSYYKNFIDTFFQNSRVLPSSGGIAVNGRTLTLYRADGSSESVETQDTLYDDSNLRAEIEQARQDLHVTIIDNLDSQESSSALSANQGSVLKSLIDEIRTAINITDTDFSNLQDIINFIEENRDLLNDLSIQNIRGLQAALDNKVNKGSDINTAPNADLLQGKRASDFVELVAYTAKMLEITTKLTSIETQMRNFVTQSDADLKIHQAIVDLNIPLIVENLNGKITELREYIDTLDIEAFKADVQKLKEDLKEYLELSGNEIQEKIDQLTNILENTDLSSFTAKMQELEQTVQESNQNLENTVNTLNNNFSELAQNVNTSLADKANSQALAELNSEFSSFKVEVNNNFKNISSYPNVKEENESFYELNKAALDELKTSITGNSYLDTNSKVYCERALKTIKKQKEAPVRIIEPDLSQFDLDDETKTYNYSWEVVFDKNVAEPKLYMGDPEFDTFSAILLAYETPSSAGGAPNKFLFKAGLRETLFENIEDVMCVFDTNNGLTRKNKTSPTPLREIPENIDQMYEEQDLNHTFLVNATAITPTGANKVFRFQSEQLIPSIWTNAKSVSVTFNYDTGSQTAGTSTPLTTSARDYSGLKIFTVGDYINEQEYYGSKTYTLFKLNEINKKLNEINFSLDKIKDFENFIL